MNAKQRRVNVAKRSTLSTGTTVRRLLARLGLHESFRGSAEGATRETAKRPEAGVVTKVPVAQANGGQNGGWWTNPRLGRRLCESGSGDERRQGTPNRCIDGAAACGGEEDATGSSGRAVGTRRRRLFAREARARRARAGRRRTKRFVQEDRSSDRPDNAERGRHGRMVEVASLRARDAPPTGRPNRQTFRAVPRNNADGEPAAETGRGKESGCRRGPGTSQGAAWRGRSQDRPLFRALRTPSAKLATRRASASSQLRSRPLSQARAKSLSSPARPRRT